MNLDCLKGPSMKGFHEEMMSNLFSSIIKEVIRALIPTKNIERTDNIEESELFDGGTNGGRG